MNGHDRATRPDWLTPELFPYQSRFIELGAHTVHYVDEGEGPVLLMLHGNPTWSFLYRHLIGRLRDRFRCIALDYPGFGLSTPGPGYDLRPESHEAVVRGFVERLGLRAVTVVGQDWGGPIGLGVAGQRPDLVRALVLTNTWAWPVDDDPHFVRFSRLLGSRAGGFAIRHGNAFVNVLIPLGTRRRLSRVEMRAYRRALDSPARREASHILPREIVGSTSFLARVEARLDRLNGKPALLCWGDADMAFRERERARFAAVFPEATTVTFRGARHFVPEDAPEDMAAAIRSWWDDRVGGGPG